jgi:hypothetical protein
MTAFHFTPTLCALVRLTATSLRDVTIWVEGGQVPWAVRNGRAYPLPLGRRMP